MFQKLKVIFKRLKAKREYKKYWKKPKRCIDPCIKYCQECRWGYCIYPEDTTRDDFDQPGGVCFESGCTLGLEDTKPTRREERKFKRWCEKV